MPNIALLFGASLIGVLAAGLYMLYNDGGFSNFHEYERPPPRSHWPPPPPSPPRQRRNVSPGRRRRQEQDANCVICCDTVNDTANGRSITLDCKHKFHSKCIQNWIKQCVGSPTCPICRSVIDNHVSIQHTPLYH